LRPERQGRNKTLIARRGPGYHHCPIGVPPGEDPRRLRF
jgi:hypothetical protein